MYQQWCASSSLALLTIHSNECRALYNGIYETVILATFANSFGSRHTVFRTQLPQGNGSSLADRVQRARQISPAAPKNKNAAYAAFLFFGGVIIAFARTYLARAERVETLD